jgi:enterochelin esterase-like enzyme
VTLQKTSPYLSATAPSTPGILAEHGLKIPTGTAAPDCLQKGGRFVQKSLDTGLLRKALEYRIYLPPCYDEHPQQHYPVLYLIHGQSYTDDQWERLGVGKIADRLIASGEIPPLLVVMPRDRVWTQPTEDMFGEALATILIPAIDEHFRTIADRPHRAIGGLSRGAGWAVHLGLKHWQLFGTIGAHSLAVFYADSSHIREWLQAIPRQDLPRFYLDIGSKDRPEIMQSATWFEQILVGLDIPHEWYMFQGYHDEAYWSAHVETYLRWYTAAW